MQRTSSAKSGAPSSRQIASRSAMAPALPKSGSALSRYFASNWEFCRIELIQFRIRHHFCARQHLADQRIMHTPGGELALRQFTIHRGSGDAIRHGDPRTHQRGDIFIRKM